MAAAGCNLPGPASSARPTDVRREVLNATKSLESKDEVVLMKATASLAMLATLPESVSHLALAIPLLVGHLRQSELVNVKKNACAALTSIMNASPTLYLSVIEFPGMVDGLVHCLNGRNPSVDETLQVNAAAGLSIFAQREEGLAKIKDASGEDALISLLASSTDGKVLEEAVDALCALATYESMRTILFQKGAVSTVANLMLNTSSEVCVRALLALGMLCGSSPPAQIALAETEGAIQTLLKLMRSSDKDIQGISRDLLKLVTSNDSAKSLVEQCLRS